MDNDDDIKHVCLSGGEYMIFLDDEDAERIRGALAENPECGIEIHGPIDIDEIEEGAKGG